MKTSYVQPPTSYVSRNILSILIVLSSSLTLSVHADYARGMEYFRKAYAAYQAQNLNDALTLVKSAINEDTGNAQHFALQGDIYYNLQDLVGARDSWGRALQLNPKLDVVKEKLDRLKVEKDVEERLEAASESIFELRAPDIGTKDEGRGRDYRLPKICLRANRQGF